MKLYRFFVILVFSVFLYGDIMYEMTTKTEGMMGMGEESAMTIYIKGDRSRTEMMSKDKKGEVESIMITRLDKGVTWMLEPEKKEYYELKLSPEQSTEPEEKEVTAVPDIAVEKTGNKKTVLGKECEEVIIRMKAENEEGGMDMTQTLWVTKDVQGYEEINAYHKKLIESGQSESSSSPMMDKEKMAEFQKKVQEIEGFPLESTMAMTMGAGMMSFTMKMHSIVTKIDNAAIDTKVFEIPQGYTLKE